MATVTAGPKRVLVARIMSRSNAAASKENNEKKNARAVLVAGDSCFGAGKGLSLKSAPSALVGKDDPPAWAAAPGCPATTWAANSSSVAARTFALVECW